MSVTCLFFVITGIQFWISYYIHMVLEIDEKTVFICFAIICITAPTLGVLSGGYIIQKLGGYNDTRAIEICLKLGYITGVISIPLPFVSSLPTFIFLIWLLLFFGGAIVPGLTGININ